VAVVDESTAGAEAPAGRVGEIRVNSPSVGRGYWNRPGDTRATFHNHLPGGEGPFLRTGDLGFLDRGELFVAGRSKDVIIHRGRNLYPQDVEAAVERLLPVVPANSCAAFGVEAGGEERLALVLEADRALLRAGPEREALAGRIRQAVEEKFRVPVHAVAFVRPNTFPRTSSGKVQRRACREGFLAGTLDVLK
jgi:acyl-CoA synthetase (AMP-forming)/AMP-acid ligase II